MAIFQNKAFRWGAGLAAILAAVWFSLPYLIDVNSYRGLIQDQLRTKLKREVAMGPMELSVVPLSIRIRDFSIQEDPALAAVSKRPFAAAKELRVSLGLFALLRRQVEVSSLTLQEPEVELIRKKDGTTWNFSTLGSDSGDSSAGPSIDRLLIVDGRAGFTDLSAAKPERQQYDHIDVDLRDYKPGKPFKVDAEAHLPGEGKPSIAWSGSGTAGKLKLVNVTVRSAQQFLKQKDAADVDAVVSGEIDCGYENSLASAKGKIHLEKLRIRKSNLTFPVDLQVDGQHNVDKKRTDLKALEIAVGGTKLNVSGTVEDQTANLKVSTTRSPIDELLKLYAALGAGADAGMQAKGSLTADVSVTGSLEKPALNGNVEATGLEVRNSSWKQPVKIADLKLALNPKEIRSTPFQIEAGGTKLAGNFALTNYTTDASTIDASVKADNASVAELLSVGQAFGMAAPGVTGSGLVDLDVRVQGSAKKPKYNGKGRIEKAQLNLPGVSKPVTVPQLDARFEEDGVWIDTLQANLAGSNLSGKLSLQDFRDPVVKFALDIDRWNMAEMQQVLGTSGSASGGGGKPSTFNKATGGGTVHIGTLDVNNIVLTQVNATCTLDHGVVVLDPLKAELFGGGVSGRIAADMRPAEPEITVRAKMDQVDANKLVSAATPLKQVLFGKFGADTDLKLTAGGDMVKSMNGGMSIQLADGKLAGVNMLNEISKFAKFFGYSAQQANFTDFVKMGGTLKIVNGIAQTNDLDVQMAGARLSGAGTMNLVAQTLDMKIGAVLDSEFSKKVGGSQVGGFMVTALADERGQLIIPSMLRGSFAKPVVSPDPEQFAKLKVKSLVSPAGMQDPAKTVQGVIDLFRKKKPEDQKKPQP
jgi:uncharacterized protein involved in outer membrane biogenesis